MFNMKRNHLTTHFIWKNHSSESFSCCTLNTFPAWLRPTARVLTFKTNVFYLLGLKRMYVIYVTVTEKSQEHGSYNFAPVIKDSTKFQLYTIVFRKISRKSEWKRLRISVLAKEKSRKWSYENPRVYIIIIIFYLLLIVL